MLKGCQPLADTYQAYVRIIFLTVKHLTLIYLLIITVVQIYISNNNNTDYLRMSTDKKLVINDHLHGVVFKNDILSTLKKIGS